MKTGSLPSSSSDLTVLVFKDNSTARTFRVPIGWISRLGLFTGLIAVIAILGVFLSLKYYLTARTALRTADPAYVQDLEQEVASLRAAKISTPAPVLPTTQASTTAAATAPAPTVTVTAVSHPSILAFSALPDSTQPPPPAAEIPIQIHEPLVEWAGRTLKVEFFIHYVKEDKGSQQGRIVLLARGPDTVIAYPSGALNPSDSRALIAPEKGEYFSVSRMREVKADFGPMKSASALKTVEVFIFSNQDGLLIHETLTPSSAPARKKSDEKEDQ